MQKTLITLTAIFTLCSVLLGGTVNTADEALTVLKTQIAPADFEQKMVFKAKSMSSKSETIGDWRGDLTMAPTEGWFFFVDDNPGANWEHPCRYAFVTKTGEIHWTPSMSPPYDMDAFEPVPTEISRQITSAENRRPTRTIFNPQTDPYTGEKYALLVSGGYLSSSNHVRYWNDLSNIYCTLVDIYGFEDDHIFVLCSDGLDPAPDQSNGQNSDPDLDGDNDDDIIGPALLPWVEAVMDSIAGLLTEEDLFLYFQTDHGSSNTGWSVYANLWNQQELQDEHFAEMLEAFPLCEQSYCFEQCFSGGFMDDIMWGGINKRDFNSACTAFQYSWAMPPNYEYDEFVFDWTAALRGEDAYGVPVDADYTGDGYISMQEAFIYAKRNDVCNEEPQYASNPNPFGFYETLNGLIEFYNTRIVQTMIDDDNLGSSSGNGDGEVNAGETVELSLELRNACTLNLAGLTGILESADPYAVITSGECVFPDIPLLGFGSSENDPFVVEISPDCPAGYEIEFTLSVTDENDSTSVEAFSLTCITDGIDAFESSSALLPAKAVLSASPNPFNIESSVDFTIPEDGVVRIRVFDLLGRQIADLANGNYTAGSHQVVFDAGRLSSGFYFINMEYNNETMMIKSLLIK